MKRAATVSRLLFVVLLSYAIAGAGCSGDDTNVGSSDTDGDFAVNVSSGDQPTYSWVAGKAFSVSVVRASDPDNIVWGAIAVGAGEISSPVKHGTVPEGAELLTGTERTLVPGIEYRVTITLLEGVLGSKSFTP